MRVNEYTLKLNKRREVYLADVKARNYPDKVNADYKIVNMLNDIYDLSFQAEEYCYMVCMDAVYAVKGIFEIGHGTYDECMVHPREVFTKALMLGTVGFILVHNHPSGDCKPSQDDMNIANRIREGAALLGLLFFDFIVVGHSDYTSFKEKGLLGSI